MSAPSAPTAATLLPSRDALHNLCLADPLWVERYQGWTELGHGGSATVVRTFGKALGEDLALKVFPRLSADDWTRFRQEVRNAQRLTSPCIVRTYSPFPRPSFAWIELELIEGQNLKQALDARAAEGRPFSASEALEIALALATALLAAHTADVVHRDVKPANVLLPRSGTPVAKLGDFGISRLSGGARLTKTGLLVGTPQFAAPEVIGGSLGGPPADVYSLSLCLYLLLSNNRFPFRIAEDSPPTHWLRAHTDQAPAALSAFRPDAPSVLVDLLARGLAKDPGLRPTAAQFLDTLATLHAGTATSAPSLPSPRRPAARAGIGLAALGLAVLGGWLAVGRGQPLPAVTPPAPARSDGGAAGLRETATVPAAAADSAAPAVPPPAAEPVSPPQAAARPSRALQAALQSDLLTLRNQSGGAFARLRVAVVATDGRRHTLLVPDGLGPQEAVFLALDSFVPRPAAGERFQRVEVAAYEGAGPGRTVVLPLP